MGDKKGLGIVITPKHITELFVDIANIDKDDVVFDNCCGTASFLISAMKKMTDEAGNDESKKKGNQRNSIDRNRTTVKHVCFGMCQYDIEGRR